MFRVHSEKKKVRKNFTRFLLHLGFYFSCCFSMNFLLEVISDVYTQWFHQLVSQSVVNWYCMCLRALHCSSPSLSLSFASSTVAKCMPFFISLFRNLESCVVHKCGISKSIKFHVYLFVSAFVFVRSFFRCRRFFFFCSALSPLERLCWFYGSVDVSGCDALMHACIHY